MQSSFYRRTLPKFILALVALTVGVFLSRGDTTYAFGTFGAQTTVTLTSSANGANADTTFLLTIGAEYNFSSVVNSTPAAATIKCGPAPVAPTGCDNTAPPAVGDVVGSLTSLTSLGLTNAPCTPFPPPPITFIFLNATVDITDMIAPVPAASANTGDGGVTANQWTDDGASPGADAPWTAAGGWTDSTATTSALSVGERTNGLPAQVDDYPRYLNEIFTPDGGGPVQPIARYAGASNVGGTVAVLNLVVFAPNALANAFPAPHPFHDLRGMGYTSIAVLQNPLAEAAPSSITDFCAPLTTTSVINGIARANPCNGAAGPPNCDTPTKISKPTPGANTNVRYANPAAAGTYTWVSFHQSLRDADGDSKENSFDPCPTNADILDGRTGLPATEDDDSDGIPDICDPDDVTGGNDEDLDGWQNRGDNCSVNNNPTNVESENAGTYAAAAPRGGPRSDGMGDPCDPNPAVANGAFLTTLSVDPHCIGGTDADGDGWCTVFGGNANLNDPNDGNAAVRPEHVSGQFRTWMTNWGSGETPPVGQPTQLCNDGIDNDGDGSMDTADAGCTGIDIDGDGYSFAQEDHIGTSPLRACDTSGAPVAPSAFWPSDFAGGAGANKVNLADITSFTAPPATKKFGTVLGNPNYNVRWDLVPSDSITLADITQLTAGLDGSTNKPSMLETGGVYTRAFNAQAGAWVCTLVFKN